MRELRAGDRERASPWRGSDRVELDDLPAALRGEFEDVLLPSIARNDTMRAWGSRYARLVLERCGDNKRQACDVLGISYHTLQAYLRHRDRPVARATGWQRRGGEPDRGAGP